MVRDQIPVGVRFSAAVQTGPGAHPAAHSMGTGSFLGVKRPGRGVDHPPPSRAEVKERVELHLYYPSGPSWPALEWTLPFHSLGMWCGAIPMIAAWTWVQNGVRFHPMTICIMDPSLPVLHRWKGQWQLFPSNGKAGPIILNPSPSSKQLNGITQHPKMKKNSRLCCQQKTLWLQSFGMRNCYSCEHLAYWKTVNWNCYIEALQSLNAHFVQTVLQGKKYQKCAAPPRQHHVTTEVMDDVAAPSLQSWPCKSLVLWNTACKDPFYKDDEVLHNKRLVPVAAE